jgi:hypothetical protein
MLLYDKPRNAEGKGNRHGTKADHKEALRVVMRNHDGRFDVGV